MEAGQRIQLQPCWVLHRRDFRDSSQIIEVLSREHGRLGLVARGVKRPKSRLRGILQPFAPLLLSWVAGRELATLSGAEPGQGAPHHLQDTRLMSGFYINELILRLTHRFDPQPDVFDRYAHCLQRLSGDDPVAATLRDFELDLLDALGFAPNLTHDVVSGAPVEADRAYDFVVDEGPHATEAGAGVEAVDGFVLLAMAARDWREPEVLRTARRLLGRAIDLQLDGKPLHTRRVLRDLRQRDYGTGAQ
ncbi:MAG: DNA repair protein RecO [Pseudomonadota bacterium]